MRHVGKTLVRASVTRLLGRFVDLCVGFYLMPIIIRELGDRDYGIWVLAGTLLGFYGLCDLGLSTAAGRFLSRALGRGDRGEFQAVFTTSLYLFLLIGVVLLAVTGVLVLLSGCIISNPADAVLFRWLAVILGSSLAMEFPARAFRAVLASQLRYDMTNAGRIVATLVRLPLVLLVFHMGYGLLALAVAMAALQLASAIGIVIMALRVTPGLAIQRPRVDLAQVKALSQYCVYAVVAQVADMLRSRISPVIIATCQAVTIVTPYAIAHRLSLYVTDLSRALVSGLDPLFSRQEGQGNRERMRFTYQFMCRTSTYWAVLWGGLLCLVGGAFIERWIGPQYSHVSPVLIVLTIGSVASSSQIPTVGYLYGVSLHRFYAVSSAISGVLCMILTLVLIRPYGLMGVAVGATLPTILVQFFVQPLYVCRTLEIDIVEFCVSTARNVAVPLVFLLGAYSVSARFIVPSYLNLFIIGAISCTAFIPYVFCIGFNRSQRESILHALTPKVLRRKAVPQNARYAPHLEPEA